MWARRIGCPSQYPSRVRVILQSLGSGAVGIAVYQYMNNLQINNLDVAPSDQEILDDLNVTCVTSWPRRSTFETGFLARYFSRDAWIEWQQYQFNSTEYVRQHMCTASVVGLMEDCTQFEWPGINASYGNLSAPEACETTFGCFWSRQLGCKNEAQFFQGSKCTMSRVPVLNMNWGLGYPLGDAAIFSSVNDTLFTYANIFGILCLLNVAGFIVHDLALLDKRRKNYVLDWPGLNQGFPLLAKFPTITFVPQVIRMIMRNIARAKVKSKFFWILVILGVLLLPLLLVWTIISFMVIMSPMLLLVFLFNPVRLSRIWVFIALVSMAVHGLILVVLQSFYLSRPELRPRYAITWEIMDSACECGCNFYMTSSVHERLVVVGLGVMLNSILTAVRCLKGLRRSQWANLLSVLFPVPVAVYSAKWSDPLTDEPPLNRDEETGAQEEVAFDPFALMDEQPASKYYTLILEPRLKYKIDDGGRWKPFSSEQKQFLQPGAIEEEENETWQVQPTEYIGCLGFPCLTGGYSAIMPSSDSEEEGEVEMDDMMIEPPAQPEPNSSKDNVIHTSGPGAWWQGKAGTSSATAGSAATARRTSQFRMLKGKANQFASHIVTKKKPRKKSVASLSKAVSDAAGSLELGKLEKIVSADELEKVDRMSTLESALTMEADEYEEDRANGMVDMAVPANAARVSVRRRESNTVPLLPTRAVRIAEEQDFRGRAQSAESFGVDAQPAGRSNAVNTIPSGRRRSKEDPDAVMLVPSMRRRPQTQTDHSTKGRRSSLDSDETFRFTKSTKGGATQSMHSQTRQSTRSRKMGWVPALIPRGTRGIFSTDDLEANAIGKSAFNRASSIDFDSRSAVQAINRSTSGSSQASTPMDGVLTERKARREQKMEEQRRKAIQVFLDSS